MLEHGRMATQASGSVLVHYGESRVLVTVGRAKTENMSFFPLSVEYEERFYAGGKIPGGFFKREGRPSEQAILVCRMTDRPIRPLFPDGYREQVQIIATVLSATKDDSPEIAAMLGASTALMLSDAPFMGPIAGVRIGRVDGELIVNPNHEQREASDMDIIIAGTKTAVTMVEGSMDEIPEDQVVESINVAHTAIKELIALQEELLAQVTVEKIDVEAPEDVSHIESALRDLIGNQLEGMRQPMAKFERSNWVRELRDNIVAAYMEANASGLSEDEADELEGKAKSMFKHLEEDFVRKTTVATKVRFDGRQTDELRDVSCEVGLLPRTHGSSLFLRGETQSLGTCTLGTTRQDEQMIDLMLEEGRKRFMLHYNFPPYSVGEVGRVGSPKRREIGHGYLAANAIEAIIPDEADFPYSIRLVSEILESNGSSSMATVCSGVLAMMDAGVPIKKPVAGIAMGMIEEGDEYVILTDISGYEDHCGDMDFKVAGTRDGVTAFQLDVKVTGISPERMSEALGQARDARLKILDAMEATISIPREDLSPHAPRIVMIQIDPEKIGTVIGPGGKIVRAIQAETGSSVDISEDGVVKIASADGESLNAAVKWVQELTQEVEVGNRYTATVARLERYGAFVEFAGGNKGLIRTADLDTKFVKEPGDVLSIGDEVNVEVVEVDDMGRINMRRLVDGSESDSGAGASSNGGGSSRPPREEKPAPPPATVGDTFSGTIKSIKEYGAFVTTDEGHEGLIHISALSDDYVKNVEDIVQEGDTVEVELIKIDDQKGRFSFKLLDHEDDE
jgi:polyribonucleotide nucleotidyltransferase